MLTNITQKTGLILLLFYAPLNIQQAAAQTTPQLSNPSTLPAKLQANRAICPAQLSNAIEIVTNRPQFSRGRWGIIVQMSPSTIIYAAIIPNHQPKHSYLDLPQVRSKLV